MPALTRRLFATRALSLSALALPAGLGGCMSSMREMPVVGSMFGDAPPQLAPATGSGRVVKPDYAQVYGTFPGETHPVPPVRYAALDPVFLRQEVPYPGAEAPGSLVVDPHARFLYHVLPRGRADRYGVGVGREGFAWAGTAQINMKRDWPDWIPPKEMVARDPEIRSELTATPRGLGVPGGAKSPLGARAMYLFAQGIGDTGYRIHGTTEPETIGTEVSSGCIRMINQDIIHLYSRTPEGATVVVRAA